MKLSTGLRNAMLADSSLRGALGGFVIRVYEGSVPASPDDAVPGNATQLVEVSLDGSGDPLSLETAASGGVISKAPSESWQGTTSANGQAQFFRIVKTADAGDSSQAAVRIQGGIGTAGEDMNFSSTALSQGAVQRVDFLNLTLPVT